MTPDEVFAKLRDIHTPEGGMGDGPDWAALDPRPLAVFGVIAVLLMLLPLWRRWRARRALRSEIARLARIAPAAQRDALARLSARARPASKGAPDIFYLPPQDIGDKEAATLRRWFLERIG